MTDDPAVRAAARDPSPTTFDPPRHPASRSSASVLPAMAAAPRDEDALSRTNASTPSRPSQQLLDRRRRMAERLTGRRG